MATTKPAATKILPCRCEHAFQDERYGPGKRVHNPVEGEKWRCTVCKSMRAA